jgi:hypothetical protein
MPLGSDFGSVYTKAVLLDAGRFGGRKALR